MTESKTPSCSKCGQIVKNPEFPKCMYCGHPVPESDRLSEEAAKEFLRSKHKQKKAAQDEAKRKSEGEWGYRKYRESGGYDEDEGFDVHWQIGSGD